MTTQCTGHIRLDGRPGVRKETALEELARLLCEQEILAFLYGEELHWNGCDEDSLETVEGCVHFFSCTGWNDYISLYWQDGETGSAGMRAWKKGRSCGDMYQACKSNLSK